MKREIAISGASAVVAVFALFQSCRTDEWAEGVSRTEVFLDLRARFENVYDRLPDFDQSISEYTEADCKNARRYWHHSFDEWYVTTRLNRRYMHDLWTEFYSKAIRSGIRHQGLREIASKMVNEEEEFGDFRPAFANLLDSLARLNGDSLVHPLDACKKKDASAPEGDEGEGGGA